jgi:hypothetical protein
VPRGGKRPGAGAKRTRPPAKRRLMLELDASEAKQLSALEARLEAPASVVLRYALGLFYASFVHGTENALLTRERAT